LDFLTPIFARLRVKPECTFTFNDGVLLLYFSGADLGAIIGRRGETLNALQYLTSLAVNRKAAEYMRIVLDVEGYRRNREETLARLAKKMADKAVRSGRRVELEPMSPNERRIVHLALQEDKRVESLSRGEEPYRRVMISVKRGRSPRH
jgi:spoIIIJ-associated protein